MSRYFGLPLRNGLPLGLGSTVALRAGSPAWLSLVQAAESAAAAAGASLWYVPPEGYAARAVNGPFVGSDGSGGVPAVGSGVVGWLRGIGAGDVGANIVTNGNFESGLTGWDSVVGTQSVSGGALVLSGDLFAASSQLMTFSVGVTYLVTATVVSPGGPGGRAVVDYRNASAPGAGARVQIANRTTAGEISAVFVPTVASSRIELRCDGVAGASFDNIVVRAVPGNHATQSTSANRPVLVAAPGAAAAAAGLCALSYDSTDLLVAPLASSGTPGYFDVQDNGTERTTPAAATTTTITLQVPNGRQLLVAVAHPTAVPSNVVTAVRNLANFMRGV